MDQHIQQPNEVQEIPSPESVNKKTISPLFIAGTGLIIMIFLIVIAMMTLNKSPLRTEQLPEKLTSVSQKKLPDGTATPVPSSSVFPLSEKENDDILNIDLGDIDNDLKEVEQDIDSL